MLYNMVPWETWAPFNLALMRPILASDLTTRVGTERDEISVSNSSLRKLLSDASSTKRRVFYQILTSYMQLSDNTMRIFKCRIQALAQTIDI